MENIAKVLNKTLDTLVAIVLAELYHDQLIAQIQAMGVRFFAIFDGDMHGSLLPCPYHPVKGDNEENRIYGADELNCCKAMRVEANRVLTMENIAKSGNVIFSVPVIKG